MQLIKGKTYEDVSRKVALVCVGQITGNPQSVLGFATGSTPLGLYKELIDAHRRGDADFSRCTSFNLDEYVGMKADDPNSYHFFMEKELFGGINMPIERRNIPNGDVKSLEDARRECDRYESAIDECGGIDLQILGIGHDGHIGFNEPLDHFPETTHIAALTELTRNANARYFPSIDDVPRHAITMGIGTIMKSRVIILIATGSDKAEIIERTLKGPITPMVPASILRLHHNVMVFLDEAAAGRL